MSPPANSATAVTVTVGQPEPPAAAASIPLPPSFLEKCYIPYTRNVAPALNGHPIVVKDAKATAPDNALCLSPILINLAHRVLKAELAVPLDTDKLRVTALCTPQLDTPTAVDAAVCYLAYQFKADVIILDANDLADGEHGCLGTDFCAALWTLYSRQYELKDEANALCPVERAVRDAKDEVSGWEDMLDTRIRAVARYEEENGLVAKPAEASQAEDSAQADDESAAPEDSTLAKDDGSPTGDEEPAPDADAPPSGQGEAPVDDDEEPPVIEEEELPVTEGKEPPIAEEDPVVDDEELRYLKQDVADAQANVDLHRSDLETRTKALDELKAQHAQREEARAAQYATAQSWLRALLKAGGAPSTRRRVLYLRNFVAMSYAFSPLVHPLLTAISESKLPVTVVAGVWRVPMMHAVDSEAAELQKKCKRKHDVFLKAFETGATLLSYVNRKCHAEWRQANTTNSRAESLSDLFFRAVMHRYYVADRLRSGGYRESLRVDDKTAVEFSSALTVALVGEPPAPRTSHHALPRHLLALHIPALQDALRDSHKKKWPGTVAAIVDEWMVLAQTRSSDSKMPLTPSSVSKLTSVLHKTDNIESLVSRFASWLPPSECITTADVFSAIEKADAAHDELTASLSVARDGPPKKTESAPSVAEQVKNATDLDEFEKRLLDAIIDPATITTTYKDVCLQPHIIETLRSVVSLPLLYADAYSTGILGRESMAGVLLYGPPGTGKTMICRALAKESGANMLQIQASTIRSMWHSEDEKLIHATFTLARRLGPCVIFIDEIEALFGSRAHGGSIHRSTLTEFLQEMDGLKSASENKASKVVIVGATNRPQDLDDAVLRRLPRRLLVDLPSCAQRETIIKHYLKGEKTDATVDIPSLAARTTSYSGSDLKHLVFSAALSAFKETVPDLWEAGKDTGPLPPRVIGSHHFEQALREIVASASTHLDSIAELRKWGGSTGV